MKKLFLFAVIVAGASASFGQTKTSSQPVQRTNTAQTATEARAAKVTQDTKKAPARGTTTPSRTAKPMDKPQSK